jgi:4-amino-4-deoxy-L-arabinose transferase-like glycosyltransferase
MNRQTLFIIGLTLVGFALRLYKADIPDKPIGDEVYYVPEARNALGINEEGVPRLSRVGHPPLAIILISLGIRFLGDNPLGWRVSSVIAGSLAIPVFYLLARRLFWGRKEYAYAAPLASFLFAFETLGFYFSRVARIDIFMLVFLLVGAYFLLDGKRERRLLSTPFFALAFLSKEAALIIILPLLVYAALRESKKDRTKRDKQQVARFDWRLFLQLSLITAAVVAAVWYFIEWVLLTPTRANLVERVFAMLSRLSISNPSATGRSEIWQWFFNYPVTKAVAIYPGAQIEFSRVVTGPLVTPGLRYAYIIQVSWTVLFFTLPVMGYMLLLAKSDELAQFTVFYWLGGIIGWVVVNVVFRGLIYLYYILTILPPVILAISYYIGRKLYLEQNTKQIRWTALTLLYCILHLVNFFLLYPVPIP